MKKNFTPEDLLQLHYGEKDSFEQAEIKSALENDPSLKSEYEDIEHVMHHLDADMKNPSPSSIKIILNYSMKSGKRQQDFETLV